jgi:Trk K+ transport system NAD-binding subunit
MAHPNLNSPTNVEGLSVASQVGTSATTILSNASDSSATIRVVSMYVANVDGSSAADVSVRLATGTNAWSIVSTVSVPADATVEIISGRPLYLKEGDSLTVTASAPGDLEAVVSYEKIT